jgi:hypothetical protein
MLTHRVTRIELGTWVAELRAGNLAIQTIVNGVSTAKVLRMCCPLDARMP